MALRLDLSLPNLEGIFQRLPMGVLVHRGGIILFANPFMLELLGYSDARELYGVEPVAIVHPDDRWIVRGRIRNTEEGRVNPPIEERLLHKDGRTVHVEVSGMPVTYEGLPSSMAFFRDLSQSKVTESEASQNHRRFQAIFESDMAAQMILNDRGVLVEANIAAAKMLGLPLESLRGRSFLDFFSDPCQSGKEWEEALRNGVFHKEQNFQDAEGRIFPAAWSCRPRMLLGEHFVSFQDRSAQVKAEEKLRQAQKMEAVGQLAGGVAHDFNNILMAITMNCQLMIEEWGEKKGCTPCNRLEDILESCKSATALTRQLLAFSRQQGETRIILDLNEQLRATQKILKRLLRENVELSYELDAEEAWISADPGQVDQILLNLGVNACDAMPSGGPLKIRTANIRISSLGEAGLLGLPPGDYVRLSVQDGGVGMDEAVRRRVFEPFFTTKAPGRGTGMGLSTVYGIVTSAGGSVQVQSEPGKGSCFYIYLPRSAAAVPAPEAVFPLQAEGGTESVLLVEDEAALRRALGQALRSKGYHVTEAENGLQALDLVADMPGPPQAMITDLIMPGMDGIKLAEAMMQRHAVRDVIFMSGYPDTLLSSGSTTVRPENFFQKPARLEAILARLRQLLDSDQDDPGHSGSPEQV